MSTDAGSHWDVITPDSVLAPDLGTVWFLDPLHGWATVPPKDTSLTYDNPFRILRTVNGGRDWTSVLATVPPAPYGALGPAYIFFLDASRGWISLDLGNNTAGTSAVLLSTRDGGKSWVQRPIPLNEPVRFSTPDHGWTAGGTAGDRLYETRDGARTWHERKLPALEACGSTSGQFEVPTFWSAVDGAFPISVGTEDRGGIIFFETHDAGRTWRPTTPLCPPGVRDQAPLWPTDIVGPSMWLVAFDPVPGVFATSDGGKTWKTTMLGAMHVIDLEFVSLSRGWLRVASEQCLARAGDCFTKGILIRATEMGTERPEPPARPSPSPTPS